MQTRATKRRRTCNLITTMGLALRWMTRTAEQLQQQQQDDHEWEEEKGEEAEEEQGVEVGETLAAFPAANWHRRGNLLEEYLVRGGVLPRELVGIVDGYCGHDFESMSVASS